MVTGQVKEAMGIQRSTTPCGRHHHHHPSSPSPASQPKSSSASGFSRYFPRTSSAQVRPKLATPNQCAVSDLLRLVEELQEKEARLKTELLEYKILKETVAVVPFLEKEIVVKNEELEKLKRKVVGLEEENEVLRLEVENLGEMVFVEEEEEREVERRIEEMEGEIEELKKAMVDRNDDKEKNTKNAIIAGDECSSTRRVKPSSQVQVLAHDHGAKNLKLKKAAGVVEAPRTLSSESCSAETTKNGDVEDQAVAGGLHPEISESLISAFKSRSPRIPRPPPTPTSFSACPSSSSGVSSSSSCSVSSSELPREHGDTDIAKPAVTVPPPPPPPLPPVKSKSSSKGPPRQPPPPPPPPPARGTKPTLEKVRRVPELVEFYHSLMRRDSKRESSGGGVTDGSTTTSSNAKDMIGEIENRSAYLHAIKTEVETQGDFIRFLIKEVNNAAFTDIEDVVAFVKWLDDELSFLVDERAVLKHFEWPEKKADAMREAAFGYSDLKKLQSEAASFSVDVHLHCRSSMKKMQTLLEKLEHGVYNLCRVREAAMKRYKGFRIPWEWMLDTGLVSQVKLASVKLAMKSMRRVSAELEAVGGGPEEEELVLQGVRFAFRVHQFAGGFDVETMKAFQELRDKASSCQLQSQSQRNQNQQHKVVCRSSSTDC